MCVTPVNPNDANDPQNLFPDDAKYTGTPLQPGVMQATVSDPAKQQTYGYIRGVKKRRSAPLAAKPPAIFIHPKAAAGRLH